MVALKQEREEFKSLIEVRDAEIHNLHEKLRSTTSMVEHSNVAKETSLQRRMEVEQSARTKLEKQKRKLQKQLEKAQEEKISAEKAQTAAFKDAQNARDALERSRSQHQALIKQLFEAQQQNKDLQQAIDSVAQEKALEWTNKLREVMKKVSNAQESEIRAQQRQENAVAELRLLKIHQDDMQRQMDRACMTAADFESFDFNRQHDLTMTKETNKALQEKVKLLDGELNSTLSALFCAEKNAITMSNRLEKSKKNQDRLGMMLSDIEQQCQAIQLSYSQLHSVLKTHNIDVDVLLTFKTRDSHRPHSAQSSVSRTVPQRHSQETRPIGFVTPRSQVESRDARARSNSRSNSRSGSKSNIHSSERVKNENVHPVVRGPPRR